MNANFVIPSWSYWTEPTRAQPLTQMYLATILEDEGHNVTFTDMRDGPKKLPKADAHLYTVATPDFDEVKQIVKSNKGVHIAGGPHINLFPKDSLAVFDSIVVGKGEESLKQMANDVGEYKLKNFYKSDIKDNYPFPRRDFFSKDKIVTSLFKTQDIPSTTVQFSYGCPFECSFCANYNRGPITERTHKEISDEIDYLKDEYDIKGLSLQDEICIPQRKPAALEWLALMESKDVLWRGQIRAIDDEDIVRGAKKSGCIELSFGLESVDKDVLNLTGKRMSIEKVSKTIDLCKKYDIKTRIYLINGLPGEKEDIVDKTKDFIKEYSPDIVLLSSLQPYPGSPIAENPEKYGIEWINTDYAKYNHLKNRFDTDDNLDSVVPFKYEDGKGLSRKQIYNNLNELQEFLRGRGANK